MEYNSQRPAMIISEYGRNIQKMVDHAVSIKDRKERNNFAKAIITVMGQLNPHLRDVNDFKHKLWDHIFIISNFKLDVDSPYPKPTPQTLDVKPERVEYPNHKIRYKHYGKTIELMIKKAIEFKDGPEKDALIKTIANHLKKSYLAWNKESVTDEKIFKDLDELSDNKLKIPDDLRLYNVSDILASSKKKKRGVKSSNIKNKRRSK